MNFIEVLDLSIARVFSAVTYHGCSARLDSLRFFQLMREDCLQDF